MFEKTRAIAQKYGPAVVVPSLALVPMFAHAADGDGSEAIAAVAAAGVIVLAVIAAMTTFRVSKWGAQQVAKLFGR